MFCRNKLIITVIVIFVLIFMNSFEFYAQFDDEDNNVFEDQVSSVIVQNKNEPKSIFELKAKSAILMDAESGQVLFEKNSHEKLLPASITKIMSLILIMEAIDSGRIKLTDKVTCSGYAASMGGSQIYLEPGEQMTVEDLLKAIVVSSANDATVALAEHIYGSEETFVGKMNEKAKQIGMKDTHFVNATGLDEENHHTSAYDVALMSRELVNKHPLIHKYTTIWMDTLRNGEFGLANTNKLIRFYRGCDGIKTGSTSKALFSVSASANRNGFRLISVIMAAPTSKVRFAEAAKLLDHGFANYNSVLVGRKGESYGIIKVARGTKTNLDCILSRDMRLLVNKGEDRSIERIVVLEPQVIEAPVKKGQKVGEVIYKINSKEIGRSELVAKESIERTNFIRLFLIMVEKWVKIQG